MKTIFVDLSDKSILMNKMRKGDDKAIEYVISEIDRLESIIRNYEAGMDIIVGRLDSTSFKEPKPIK